MLNVGVSMPSNIDQNLAVVRDDTTFTAADRELLADFASRPYEAEPVQAMKVT